MRRVFYDIFLINKMSNDSKWGSRLCEQLFELEDSLFPKIGLGINEIYTYLMEQG